MLAPSSGFVFGMFRLWRAAMEFHGFGAQVFDEFDAAEEWLVDGHPGTP